VDDSTLGRRLTALMNATVTRSIALAMQVCVPNDWSDTQIKEFAEKENPCGTDLGWIVCKTGAVELKGDPDKVTCSQHPENVHVVLGC
jgi:hypothetical protein